MKNLSFGILYLGLIILPGCSQTSNEDLFTFDDVNVKYKSVTISSDTANNCITDPPVFIYEKVNGTVVKCTSGYLLTIENPVEEQEQSLLFPCNLPESCFVDGLEVYLSGKLAKNPAGAIEVEPGVFIYSDGEQRIFLTELYVKN
jgi:hypothetical protein